MSWIGAVECDGKLVGSGGAGAGEKYHPGRGIEHHQQQNGMELNLQLPPPTDGWYMEINIRPITILN